MGYSRRRPHLVPFLLAKSMKPRLLNGWEELVSRRWKNVSWSDDSRFSYIHILGSEFSIKPLKTWLHPVQDGSGVTAWGILSWHALGILVPTELHLNTTAFLSILADHIKSFMRTVCSSCAPCHKAQITATIQNKIQTKRKEKI